MNYTKVDLINELSVIHGYRKYLEICTATTGNMYRGIDRARFSTCQRLMYRCPAEFDDGLPIDFRSTNLDISDCARAIRAREMTYDVILVDSFHEYEPSARDLREAVNLLNPTGTIIVHDCFPRDRAITAPELIVGDWCGVTYKAYLDFVLASENLLFCTVDTDYGCGVIRRYAILTALQRIAHRASRIIAREDRQDATRHWVHAGDDFDATFKLLQAYSKPLLNLVTVEEFLTGERNGWPVLR
ncbi:MAG: hypothetical protein HY244_00965 [Rhizobiales bacterium]|nr:hypothetical protein [Hyphomicrobiales bacterium]